MNLSEKIFWAKRNIEKSNAAEGGKAQKKTPDFYKIRSFQTASPDGAFRILGRRAVPTRKSRLSQTDSVLQKTVLFYKHLQAILQVQFIKKYTVLQYFFPAFSY